MGGLRTRGGWRGRWWRARAGRAGRGRRCRRAPHLLERRDVDRGGDAALCALVALDGRRATARACGCHELTGCGAGIAARAHRSSGTARTSSVAVCSTALPSAPTRALRIAVLYQRPASVPENHVLRELLVLQRLIRVEHRHRAHLTQ